ncbi:MAG: matrixin family metalloprotease [Planctomycetes bacterium]|nr:matrixin family metalloprotease [Planctomycetota bacterium]
MRHSPIRLSVELLESRWVPAGPAIDLFTVGLHELGHSLGLPHSNVGCGSPGQAVMCPFYIGPVIQLEQADIDAINALYPETLGDATAAGRWDVKNADGTARAITFSYVPDGTQMDQGGKSTTFKTFNGIFGLPGVWQAKFQAAMAEWTKAADANGTATRLTFANVGDVGKKFNFCDGITQGSSNFGDIRIAAHRFDGPSNVLAHAYFPPPNGCSAAGDAHLDQAENWDGLAAASSSTGSGGSSGGAGAGLGFLTLGDVLGTVEAVVQEVHDYAGQALEAVESAHQGLMDGETEGGSSMDSSAIEALHDSDLPSAGSGNPMVWGDPNGQSENSGDHHKDSPDAISASDLLAESLTALLI